MPFHTSNLGSFPARHARKLKPYAKALVAGTSVAIAVAIPLVSGGLTAGEALTVVGSFLAGAFPTWAVPNRSGDE